MVSIVVWLMSWISLSFFFLTSLILASSFSKLSKNSSTSGTYKLVVTTKKELFNGQFRYYKINKWPKKGKSFNWGSKKKISWETEFWFLYFRYHASSKNGLTYKSILTEQNVIFTSNSSELSPSLSLSDCLSSSSSLSIISGQSFSNLFSKPKSNGMKWESLLMLDNSVLK